MYSDYLYSDINFLSPLKVTIYGSHCITEIYSHNFLINIMTFLTELILSLNIKNTQPSNIIYYYFKLKKN